MRKIKGVSLVLLTTPILFLGCVQEKVSTIVPVKSTDKKIVLDVTKKSQENNNSHIEIKKEIPLAKTYAIALEDDSTILNDLIIDSENYENPENVIDSNLIAQALDIHSNWESFSKEDEILETAKEFLGVKYIWAANGPSAFDCSGFTKYVFKKNGISLPRYSGHQANIGIKINFSELQKGDLVFFDTTKKFTKKVNHVGIFIGNNRFIHASSGGKKVMITSFSKKKFYKNKFLYARRVIDNESLAFKQTNTSTLTN